MRVAIHDLETTVHEWYGNLASPHNPINWVVEHAWQYLELGKENTLTEVHSERYMGLEDFKLRWKPPFDCDILVCHNAAFEMSWYMKHHFEAFRQFLARGGRIYCTAYAHYLVSNQQDVYPSLNETAPKYGGTPKVDAVSALWKAGVMTEDIDPELLHEYLAGPDGDIVNTRKVFTGTWSALTKRNMLKMALVRMDALVYSSFCMHFGLYIDQKRAAELQAGIEARLVEIQQELRDALPADMPKMCREQFTGTRFQLSALLFGGGIKYEGRVYRTTEAGEPMYVKATGPYFKSIGAALPESKCVMDHEAGGLWYCEELKEHQARYTGGKNKGEPKFEKYDTEERATKAEDFVFKCKPIIPQNVLDKLMPTIQDEWKGSQSLADGSPVFSTAEDVLEVLAAHDVGLAKLLDEKAKLDKDLGSFYMKQNSKGEMSGMLQYVQPDGFIHHTLLHYSTVTTRLSCQRPNLQQLPRGSTSQVKEMFVSRFGDDGVILQEDYSALETVGLQTFSHDSNLEKALLQGLDMHSIRLASMEELSYDYVVARTKDDKHPDHAEWDVKRTAIKPVAFQYQYGATAYGMAMSTGKTQEFCQAFIDAEKAAFPEVEVFFEEQVFKAVEASAMKIPPVRVELDDGRSFMMRVGQYVSIEGTTYQFQQYSKERWDHVQRKRVTIKEFKIPQMRNYPIQGGSGFFVQIMMGVLMRHMVKNNFYDMQCLPINQVHDAFYFDAMKKVLGKAALEIESIMELIPAYLNHMWPAFKCTVPFPVAGGAGCNMKEEHHVYEDKKAWKASKQAFQKEFLAAAKIDESKMVFA